MSTEMDNIPDCYVTNQRSGICTTCNKLVPALYGFSDRPYRYYHPNCIPGYEGSIETIETVSVDDTNPPLTQVIRAVKPKQVAIKRARGAAGKYVRKDVTEPVAITCKACGALIPRLLEPSGKYESITNWMARKYCNNECYQSTRRKLPFSVNRCDHTHEPKPMTIPGKICLYCNALLQRKRRAGGQIEAFTTFGRRNYCDQKCAGQYLSMKAKENQPK